MKIPVIKQLVNAYTDEQLEKAELALLQEGELEIDIAGEDEGEQLTNVMAAKWIKEEMTQRSSDLNTAIRAYSQKVRNSIS